MVIAALPASAVRKFGSTQCVTDSAALVKELIDNSLDADATSIRIEISSNTVDKINVRDNGHGIASEDRSLLCNRHCTSKIRNLEELQDLGGQSLGFRGEALASAVEMSSCVTVTTRIDGDSTGVQMKYIRSSSLENEKRASHPVGTTVEVNHFLSGFPVRKQTAVKHSTKCLLKIRNLLRDYSLARPHVRLSFKVLKAKDGKADWNYTPKAMLNGSDSFTSGVLDAAIQGFGLKSAEALSFQTHKWSPIGEIVDSTDSQKTRDSHESNDAYTLECFVVDPEHIDSAAVGDLGQHISIDTRPVSGDCGVLKQIARLYKACLRSAAEHLGIVVMSDPLLIMHLTCPRGSYDVNVEPAKNDILFIDAGTVLKKIQIIFESIYRNPQSHQKESSQKDTLHHKHVRINRGSDVLLAQKPNSNNVTTPENNPSQACHEGQFADPTVVHSPKKQVNGIRVQTQEEFHSVGHDASNASFYGASVDDDDEFNLLAIRRAKQKASICLDDGSSSEITNSHSTYTQGTAESVEEAQILHSNILSNPWTLAKLNADIRAPLRKHQQMEIRSPHSHLPTTRQLEGDIACEYGYYMEDQASSPSIPPLFVPHPSVALEGSHRRAEATSPRSAVLEQSGHFDLDSWVQKSKLINFSNTNNYCKGWMESTKPAENSSPRRMALEDIPDVCYRRRAKKAPHSQRKDSSLKHHCTSLKNPERGQFFSEEAAHKRSTDARRNQDNASPAAICHPEVAHSDLSLALDYEIRKTKATQDHREKLRREKAAESKRYSTESSNQRTLDSLLHPVVPHPNSNSPHKNRQAKAIAALFSNADLEMNGPLESGHHELLSVLKSRKSRGQVALLESVEEDYWVSDLILRLPVSLKSVEKQAQEMRKWDYFVSQDEFANGLENVEADTAKRWERRLLLLVSSLYHRVEDPRAENGGSIEAGDVVFNFRGISIELR